MKNLPGILICFVLLAAGTSCSNRRFNIEDWKADRNRPKQIRSLIRSKLLIGKRFAEVVQLLGEKGILYEKADTGNLNKQYRVQYLTGRTVYIDFERLLIVIDSGKVVRVEKWYD